MTKCPECGKHMLVIEREDDKVTVYKCSNCGKVIFEKKN